MSIDTISHWSTLVDKMGVLRAARHLKQDARFVLYVIGRITESEFERMRKLNP